MAWQEGSFPTHEEGESLLEPQSGSSSLTASSKIENYQKPCNNDSHGKGGPVSISNGGQVRNLR